MERIKEIIIHCSASKFGNVNTIRQWHLQNGWRDIGYHYVILNGQITNSFYMESLNGTIECGRTFDGDNFIENNEIGAHALGYNKSSIGICLIGNKEFTLEQLNSLLDLVDELRNKYNIPIENIKGHYEVCDNKSCPNFNMNTFRECLLGQESIPSEFSL